MVLTDKAMEIIEAVNDRNSHKSRKTFVSTLIDGGVNINTVREMVGHNDERTTLRYYCFDRNTDAERKNMIQNALSS